MNVVAERNEKGLVKLNNGTKFTVPLTHSMLSIFGDHNPIINGAEYRDDYWIYVNGKRVKKWFVSDSRGNVKLLWPPNLRPSNMARLEDVAYRLQQKSHRLWKEFWSMCEEARKRGGSQHYWSEDEIIVHVPGTKNSCEWQDKDTYRAFSCNEKGVSSLWHKPNKKLQHPDLGRKMAPLYDYQAQVHARATKMFYFFHKTAAEVVEAKCDKYTLPYETQIARLTVNGREYTFRVGGQTGMKVEMISRGHSIIEVVA